MSFFTSADQLVERPIEGRLANVPTPHHTYHNRTFRLIVSNQYLHIATIKVTCTKNRMSLIQIARLVYMMAEGKLLLLQLSSMGTPCFTVGTAARETLDTILSSIMSMGVFVESGILLEVASQKQVTPNNICAYDQMMRLSLSCELVRSCGWVHIGKDLNTLMASDCISVPRSVAEKSTRNVQTLHINPICSDAIQIECNIHKVYPLLMDEVKGRIGAEVTILPNMTTGILEDDQNFQNDLDRYWWIHHGYNIPPEVCDNTQVGVIFNGISGTFSYPVTCIWKRSWMFMPNYTTVHRSKMYDRLHADIAIAVSIWREKGVIDVSYLREGEISVAKRQRLC